MCNEILKTGNFAINENGEVTSGKPLRARRIREILNVVKASRAGTADMKPSIAGDGKKAEYTNEFGDCNFVPDDNDNILNNRGIKNDNVIAGNNSGGFDIVQYSKIAAEMDNKCKLIPELAREAEFITNCFNFIVTYKNSDEVLFL
ncbi:MAG: hypothetical protein VZR11_07560 [Succinimonas sp.]|nr:hypothetical protein [Succinimonas sp.]